MKIAMQSEDHVAHHSFARWDHAIFGEAVDTRGRAAVDFVRSNADSTHVLRYDSRLLAFDFDGRDYSAEEPKEAFTSLNGDIVLEATTLGFVEILFCCRAVRETGRTKISISYTEPANYNRPRRSKLVHRRDFELSDEVEEFVGVPGNSILLSPERPVKAAVFVGFEGQRLNRLLEQTTLSASSCSIIFGVPAFVPGWEMDSFANILHVLKGEQLSGKTLFCGAHNVLSGYQKLMQLHESCKDERFLIVPIGTKPHGIGAALFLCQHPDVGVIYDNPTRKAGRSDNVGRWHLFEVLF